MMSCVLSAVKKTEGLCYCVDFLLLNWHYWFNYHGSIEVIVNMLLFFYWTFHTIPFILYRKLHSHCAEFESFICFSKILAN